MRLLGTIVVTATLAITAFAATGVPNALAADKALELRHGDGTYIKARHARRYLGCPDRYSCYPLYDAYGPYGGSTYWAGYSGYVPPDYR